MIVFTRTSCALPGKGQELRRSARLLADHISSLISTTVLISAPIGGNPMQLRYTLQFADLGELENAFERLSADARYGELVSQSIACTVAGSHQDEIHRAI